MPRCPHPRPPARQESEAEPGLLIVQADGLSRPALDRLIAHGGAPNLLAFLRSGRFSLADWTVLMPTTTPASQAGILHGRNDTIPGFRWFDKVAGRSLVANHPADAAIILSRVSNGAGLLAHDGASIGNLLTGDAARTYLTMATVAREPRLPGVLSRIPTVVLNPRNATHFFFSMVLEAGSELRDALRERRHRGRRRMRRGFGTALERSVANGLVRPLSTALVREELARGTARIYVDYTSYDVLAHHGGPEDVAAMAAATDIDRDIGVLLRSAARAPRPYRLIVLSDHGQSPARTFRGAYGETIDQLVARLVGRGTTIWAETRPVEHTHGLRPRTARGRWSLELRGPLGLPSIHRLTPAEHDVVLYASGNLTHLYLTQSPGRVAMERITERYPALIDGLRSHPAIGIVLVRRLDGVSVVLAGEGTYRIDDDATALPLARYGRDALHSLRRLDRLEGVGDLVLISTVGDHGEVISFEELVGAHGGFGGPQSEGFVLYPSDWPGPAHPIVGATAFHDQLERWFAASTAAASGR